MKPPRQPKPEFNIQTILKNPVDARQLKTLIDTACIEKTKIDLCNEAIADQRNEAKDKLGMPPGVFNTLVSVRHNEKLLAEREKLQTTDATIVSLYGDPEAKAAFSDSDEDINDE